MSDEPSISTYTDDAGRRFNYVAVAHGADSLVVHFSAFFGEWGNAKPYRDTFQGYFHRLKMFRDEANHDWLFMCDQYGADANGTYYTGERGDFFVERAVLKVLTDTMRASGCPADRTVFVGSSMGATAALKFGLQLGVRGIVAIAPHIDLDICAARQNRERHVAAILADGDTQAAHNYPATRQIRGLLDAWPAEVALPGLFVQACEDDHGLFHEQVQPLLATWRAKGGSADLDARPEGGHTSDWATKPLLLDAIASLLAGRRVDVARYATEAAFAGTRVQPPLSHRLRRRASLLRKRLLRRD